MKLIKLFLTVISVIFCLSFVTGQGDLNEPDEVYIGLNSKVTYVMMEPNQNLRKLELLLEAKADGLVASKSLNLGFSIIGIANYQHTNRDSKFAYLMRHPTSNNQIGNHASEVVLHSAQVSVIGSINSWITAYGELLYSPEQSFGSGTITSLGRNQIEFRKGMIIIGDLQKCPIYLGLGKMDVPFGQMRSVNPFTNSTMWHAFGALAYSAVLGIKEGGLSISISAIQGGAQFRAANVPVDSTSVPSRINNYAADLNYTINMGNSSYLRFGGSYLKGSAYCQPWPVVHFMPCSDNNPAFTYYGELSINSRLLLQGSFAKTLNEWPGTFNPAPPLNEFAASKVTSLSLGGKFNINPRGSVVYTLSGEFSNFRAGPEGAPWERQSQIIVGLNAQVENTSRIFIEGFRTAGYAPLNFVSGGNFDDPSQTHSDRDTRGIGVVAGVLFSI